MQKMKRRSQVFILLLLTAFLLPALFATVRAESTQPRVVRVLFTELQGLSETGTDGRLQGLIIDYLNEIAKYTNWEYEYIKVESDNLLDEFATGEYDILGGNYYSPALETYFTYPDYNIGSSKSVLLARRDDKSIRSYDLRSFNGKTIGVYGRAAENIRRLEQFLNSNGITCTLKYYSYEQLSIAGNLFPYLENGEIDLLLENSFEKNTAYRVAASFDSQPYYIVTNIGNQEILDGLNTAMEKIMDSNPNFASERFAANFPNIAAIDIQLNEEELEYIRKKKIVTVAVPREFHPLMCLNAPVDLHHGLVSDILQQTANFTGLQFTFAYTDSYIDAVNLVKQGGADMLAFFLGSEAYSIEQGLALTTPYVAMNNIIVRNKTASYPDENLTAAILEGQELPGGIQISTIKTYPDITDALFAVDQGEADFIYGLSARLEQDIQRCQFSNLVPVALVNDRSDLSFALPRPVSNELLTILNKSINSLSSEKKSEILDRNLVSIGTTRLSVTELIYTNPVMFIGILTLLLLILVTAILWINHARTHAAIMQTNFQRAEAESRAKGEFLSRMSHEIRTPMNAVVGFADLTMMQEGVPEKVRDYLSKIRFSSHYLLELINDILDMSRLDSGMLSITQEPMSLKALLDGIYTMMEVQAKRRDVQFTMKQEILHTSVCGDAIRLRQVLINLLSNAFKFTPSGGKTLLLVREETVTQDGAVFFFSVKDTGIGVAAENQTLIFETFEQLGTNYNKSQGTGLGLPISKNIVQMMGGELCLKSKPGEGSEFHFTITLPLSNFVEEPAEPTSQTAHGGNLSGLRILLAEDNDLNAEIAIELLQLQGAVVCRCENGKKAVERFSKSRLDEFKVILMDIQMPEMNGLDAALAIRSLNRSDASTIPIIAMTANSFQKDVDAAMEAGMSGFISKPIDAGYLYRILQNILFAE